MREVRLPKLRVLRIRGTHKTSKWTSPEADKRGANDMENDSDSDDSGILVEEVTAAPSDDDEGVLVEEVAVSHAEDDYVIADATVVNEDASDDDAVVIEDVTHERDSSDSSSDEEEDDDDDLPVVEELSLIHI